MTYLDEFRTQIHENNFNKFFVLWEEYCTSDEVDPDEFIQILKAIQDSPFTRQAGQFAETALPAWETIKDEEASYNVLKEIINLQTTNTPQLAELTTQAIQKKYPIDPKQNEYYRLTGLRTMDNFKYALRNYDLLHHMEKGNFVFHTKGWGTGEIMDVSLLRETVTLEFEYVHGLKHLTFTNAFNTLEPMSKEHFLARRFSDPDKLEEEAKKDPVKVVKLLLRDLGPKTASEIKDELADLVIPEEDWTKWWQSARNRLKKDTMIESPASLKEPFALRRTEVTHETRLVDAIRQETDPDKIIQTSYGFVRDFPNILRDQEAKQTLQQKLEDLISSQISEAQELQIIIFLDESFGKHIEGKEPADYIQKLERPVEAVNEIEILALKKRALSLIFRNRPDWSDIFFTMLIAVDQNPLRDYIFDKLMQGPTQPQLVELLEDLQRHPEKQPEIIFWYFQKILKAKRDEIPFANKEGQGLFLESVLILVDKLDSVPEYRPLVKKMYNFLINKRYEVIRKVIEGMSIEFIEEYLLLVAKCHTFTVHDKEIMRSLAEVVHPSLTSQRKRKGSDDHIFWATDASYKRIHDRMTQISSVEMIETAKEVEAARALGDLRENAEYKYACEKRSRLQGELKRLGQQMNQARIITPHDIDMERVGIGNVILLEDANGEKKSFTILGPWDADAENGILSLNSRLAQAMLGHKIGDSIEFQGDEYTIVELQSYLDQ